MKKILHLFTKLPYTILPKSLNQSFLNGMTKKQQKTYIQFSTTENNKNATLLKTPIFTFPISAHLPEPVFSLDRS